MNKQQRAIVIVVAIIIFRWFNLATYCWVNSLRSADQFGLIKLIILPFIYKDQSRRYLTY